VAGHREFTVVLVRVRVLVRVERDAALIATFEGFRSNPRALAAQVARFL
jgi:hypothetical protein